MENACNDVEISCKIRCNNTWCVIWYYFTYSWCHIEWWEQRYAQSGKSKLGNNIISNPGYYIWWYSVDRYLMLRLPLLRCYCSVGLSVCISYPFWDLVFIFFVFSYVWIVFPSFKDTTTLVLSCQPWFAIYKQFYDNASGTVQWLGNHSCSLCIFSQAFVNDLNVSIR